MSDTIFKLVDHEVFLISTHESGRDYAMIATWVTPATLAQGRLRVVVAFSQSNVTTQHLLKRGVFSIQLLAEDQVELIPRFGLHSSRDGRNKFEGMNLSRSPNYMPLIPDTCGWMECQIVEQLDCGDRMIVVADVHHHGMGKKTVPLLKHEGYQRLTQVQRKALEEKYANDSKRDLMLIKNYFPKPNH